MESILCLGVEKVTVETTSSVVGTGQSFSLECIWKVAEGVSPEVNVSWTIPMLDASRTSYSGGLNKILHVSEAELSDSGTYECTVSGPTITSISSSVFILVEGMHACLCMLVRCVASIRVL